VRDLPNGITACLLDFADVVQDLIEPLERW